MLRAPGGLSVFDNTRATPADFIVKYTGTSVRSASGQLWDIDSGEKYLIEALDSTRTLISSITTPTVPENESPDTFSALPFDFSFSKLTSDIGFIRISSIERGNGGGFAFDNFDATGETISQDVPEPASILSLLGFAGLGSISILKRKLKSN